MSFNIIKQSREFTPVEIFLMCRSNDTVMLKDVPDGTEITVDGLLIFEDFKDNGEKVSVLSLITPEKKVFCCQSATFTNMILDIHSLFPEHGYTICKKSGKTRAGRDFITCSLKI